MNIQRIPLDQVFAEGRLRPVDQDYVRLIAASMEERGQMTPIEVRASPKSIRPFALVAGAHRLAAAALAGLTEIEAIVFVGSELEAELREIDENLIRHELKELDRATFLARRKAVYEKLHPETKHGGARTQVANLGNLTARFTAEAAEKLGFSERSVSRAIQRFTRLDAAVRDDIAGLWIADNGAQLDALAKLPPTLQRQVVDVLRSYPGLRSVAHAIAQIEGQEAPAPDPLAEQFDAFLRLWKRMPETVRRRVRQHVNAKEKANG